jgi:hypothetical protein
MTSAANVILGSPRPFYLRDGDSFDVVSENPAGLGANPGHRVRFRKAAAGISLNNVNDAEALLCYPLPDARVSFEVNDNGASTINYIDAATDTAPQGYFGADRDFHSVPGSPTFAAGNIDQAAMEARGYLYVPTAGKPNITHLAVEFKVSRKTILRDLHDLIQRGQLDENVYPEWKQERDP